MTKYYRLLCLQGTGYMATGYNTTNHEELVDDYASYKSNDWSESDEESEETMQHIWDKMTTEEKIQYIGDDEFEIEVSDTPFNEDDIH